MTSTTNVSDCPKHFCNESRSRRLQSAALRCIPADPFQNCVHSNRSHLTKDELDEDDDDVKYDQQACVDVQEQQ